MKRIRGAHEKFDGITGGVAWVAGVIGGPFVRQRFNRLPEWSNVSLFAAQGRKLYGILRKVQNKQEYIYFRGAREYHYGEQENEEHVNQDVDLHVR